MEVATQPKTLVEIRADIEGRLEDVMDAVRELTAGRDAMESVREEIAREKVYVVEVQ